MYARFKQGGGDDRRNDDKKQTEDGGGDDQRNDDKQETDEEKLKKMYLAQGARPKTSDKKNQPQETGTTSEQPKPSRKSPRQARNDSPMESPKKPKQTPPEKPHRARTSGSKPPHSGDGKDKTSDTPTGATGDAEGTVPSAGKPSLHSESTVVIRKWPFTDSPPPDASAHEDSQKDGLKKPMTKTPARTSAKVSSAKSSAGANKRPSDKERPGTGGPSKTPSAKASDSATLVLFKLQKAKGKTSQKSPPVKATADSRKTSTLKSKSEPPNTSPQSPRKSSKPPASAPTEREKSSTQKSESTKTSAKKSMGSTPKSSASIHTGQTQHPKPKGPTKSPVPTKESSKSQPQAQAAKVPTRPQMSKGSSKILAQKLKEADKSPRDRTTDSTKKVPPTHSQPPEPSPQKRKVAFNLPRKPSSKPLQESKGTSKQPSKNIPGTPKSSQHKLAAPPKAPPKSTVRQTVAQKPTKPQPAAAKKQTLRTDVLLLTTMKAAKKSPGLSENLPPQSSSESSTLPSEMSQSPDSPKPLWETEKLGLPSPHLSDPIYNDSNYETDSDLARSVSLPPSISHSDSFTSTQACLDEDDKWSFDEPDEEEGGDAAGEEEEGAVGGEEEGGAVGGEKDGERGAGEEGEDDAVEEEETKL